MPKVPAIQSWQAYQQQIATHSEITEWFANHCGRSIGIVLGKVSGLVVVDIDDEMQAANFIHQFPDLTETFTVSSGNRKLPHYYYRISSDLFVPSKYGHGVELRSNGQYVVAPASCVGDHAWYIANDIEPKMLTESDLSHILSFLQPDSHEKSIKPVNSPLTAKMSHLVEVGQRQISVAGLRRRYLRLAKQQGRNQSLFATALIGRDAVWTQSKVIDALLHPHCIQTTADKHHRETYQQRRQEAIRTIKSVFSRPPRKLLVDMTKPKPQQQLPNAVRECLMQNNLINVARVLDGLLMRGVEAGTDLTGAQVYDLLKSFGIGRNTVFTVLKAVNDAGVSFFKKVETSSPHTPLLPNAYAANRCAEQTNQCLIGRVAKSVKMSGRPVNRFEMPSIQWLCELLNVEEKGGDEIKPSALCSPTAYREALHVALIERTPGKFPRKWLAERLGVSKDSCRRYEKKRGICAIATFRDWFVGWHNVDRILPDEPNPGQFIQDENGKRYPALVSVARMLLRIGRRIMFRWQDVNHYQMPSADKQLPQIEFEQDFVPDKKVALIPAFASLAIPPVNEPVQRVAGNLPDHMKRSDGHKHGRGEIKKHVKTALSVMQELFDQPQRDKSQRGKSQRGKSQHENSQDELCVEFLYQTLDRINSQRKLTREKARELVNKYGHSQIKRGVKLLQRRSNINNPTGFLISWLKSEHLMRA